MPIALKCACGKSLRTPDALAGKKVRCPGCQIVLEVPVLLPDPIERPKPPPLPAVQLEEADDLPMVVLPARKKESDNYVMTDEPPRRRRDIAEEDPLYRIRRRSRDVKDRDRTHNNPWLHGIDASIGGGILMMVIAVVWFCGGLALDIFFIYPPILFIVGLVALIRGIVNHK
jgi:hypothetical protein